jgi:hypothetical protein
LAGLSQLQNALSYNYFANSTYVNDFYKGGDLYRIARAREAEQIDVVNKDFYNNKM